MKVLLCLHGWGGSKESFTELRRALEGSSISVLAPDLPGFGDEPEPRSPWTNDDYADWVEDYARRNIHGPFWLLGHSHGGRIALKLVTRKSLPIKRLFLCASAGIKRPRHLKRIIGLTLAKSGKFFLSLPGAKMLEPLGKKLLYKLVRVHDYEKASPMMRQTLIRVTGEDLRPLLAHVKVPTDIFWGTDDGMTPVADAKVMHKEIEGSKLHLYKGVRHGVHRDRAKEIAGVIRKENT
jgi:pimeloyl-ACP methyl ester carboxylesterase